MANDTNQTEQAHPQQRSDRQIVNTLLEGEPTDYNLCELARLLIRYDGFPGARDIQTDLTKAMQRWNLTEDTLFTRTREIHQQGVVYKSRDAQREDWS